jgi:hypothetical protein
MGGMVSLCVQYVTSLTKDNSCAISGIQKTLLLIVSTTVTLNQGVNSGRLKIS